MSKSIPCIWYLGYGVSICKCGFVVMDKCFDDFDDVILWIEYQTNPHLVER